jgi:IS30 family transposase
MVSKHNKYVLLVLVEKHTRHCIVKMLPSRINLEVNQVICDALRLYMVKSVTLDNDIAFTKGRLLQEDLKATVCFCHPFSSWEKGLAENTNGWIRSFIGRKVDIKKPLKEWWMQN